MWALSIGFFQAAGAFWSAAFLAHYLWTVRYKKTRRTYDSWWVVALNIVMLAVTLLGLATSVFGRDWPFRDQVRALVYGCQMIVLAAQYALFVDTLRRRPSIERNDDGAHSDSDLGLRPGD